MEDHNTSPPVFSSLAFKPVIKKPFVKAFKNLDLSYEENSDERDDEIVTYYSPIDEKRYSNSPIHRNNYNKTDLSPDRIPNKNTDPELQMQDLENRPQTENNINRYKPDIYNTDNLEDELCTKASIHQRLIHTRWQVRKQLYVDIADCLRTGKYLMNIETELGVFEFFEQTLKDMAWDSNITSQLEGLQTILVYAKLVPNIKNSLLFLADELIQKCGLTKQKSKDLVHQIVVELLARDTEGLLMHYVIKRFNAKNPKEACFAIGCIRQALSALPNTENIGKSLVSGLNKTLAHNVADVRITSLNLASDLYTYIADDIETYIKNLDLKSIQVKEFKEILNSKQKNTIKWTLFTKEKQKIEVNDLLILEDNEEDFKKDLSTLVPDGFFDIPYSNEIKANREKLLKFSHSLEARGLVLEKKEYPLIINTILHLIESSNTLIYTEAIKLLEILIPKIPKSFTFKYKHYIQFLSDKFKEKKKSLISSIFNILYLIRYHEVCSFENIVEVLLENSTHKVPQVREYSLNWIMYQIQKLPSTVDLLEIYSNTFPYEKVLDSLVSNYGNKILTIATKDTVGSVRDSAIRLLNFLRTLLQSNPALDAIVCKLPKTKTVNTEKLSDLENEIIHKENNLVQDNIVEIPVNIEKHSYVNENTEDLKLYKEIKDIHSLLKVANPHQKLSALNKLINLVEIALANHKKPKVKTVWRRGIGRSESQDDLSKPGILLIDVEELESFIKDIIFLCTKYKNYAQEPTLFEELQQTTVSALTSLRVIMSDTEAETVFKQLLYHLPVKNSSSQFLKTFNSSVYQLFSDWLSHLPTPQVVNLVTEAFKTNNVYNIHIVYINTIQWFLEIELKLGDFLLEHLSPLIWYLASGLFGGPLNSSHPLSQSTKEQLIHYSQVFVEYLAEVFTLDNVCLYFEEQLVNYGKLYLEFKEWCDGQRQPIDVPENPSRLTPTTKSQDVVVSDKENIKNKLEEITELHEETKRNLEEVNKEYLTQVTINYELMQRLEENKRKKSEHVHSKPAENKTPAFKNSEEILKLKDLQSKNPVSSNIPIFDPERLDQPDSFYFQQPEVLNYQYLLLSSDNPQEISIDLLRKYSALPIPQKRNFIDFLFNVLKDEDILNAMPLPTLNALVYTIIQFCTIEKIASGNTLSPQGIFIDSELTNDLQKLIGLVMEYKNLTGIINILLINIQEILPASFLTPFIEEKKIFLKILLKCAIKAATTGQNKGVRVFDVLLGLYKLFSKHPPEDLNSDSPDLADYEHMFKVLRGVSDAVIALQPEKAGVFFSFINKSTSNKSIFLKYIGAVLSKRYNISI
jgi:hypothetical protein